MERRRKSGKEGERRKVGGKEGERRNKSSREGDRREGKRRNSGREGERREKGWRERDSDQPPIINTLSVLKRVEGVLFPSQFPYFFILLLMFPGRATLKSARNDIPIYSTRNHFTFRFPFPNPTTLTFHSFHSISSSSFLTPRRLGY